MLHSFANSVHSMTHLCQHGLLASCLIQLVIILTNVAYFEAQMLSGGGQRAPLQAGSCAIQRAHTVSLHNDMLKAHGISLPRLGNQSFLQGNLPPGVSGRGSRYR